MPYTFNLNVNIWLIELQGEDELSIKQVKPNVQAGARVVESILLLLRIHIII